MGEYSSLNSYRSYISGLIIPSIIISVFFFPDFTPTFFGRTDDFIIGPNGIMRGDQALLLLFVIYSLVIFPPFVGYKLHIGKHPITILAFFIGLTILVSTLYGTIVRGYSLRVGDLFDVLVWFTISGFLAVSWVQIDYRIAQKSVIILVFSSVIVALFSILQYFGSDIWRSASVIYTDYPVDYRATGTTTNPNFLSQLLLPGFFISFGLLLSSLNSKKLNRSKSITRIPFVIISPLVIGLGIFVTFSRTGLVAGLVGLLLMILTIFSCSLGTKYLRKRLMILLGTLVLCIPIAIFVSGIDLGRYTQLLTLTNIPSLERRFEIWSVVFPLVLEAPIIGHGASWIVLESRLGNSIVDSGVLRWAYHYGVIGISLVLLMLVYSIRLSIGILRDVSPTTSPVIWSTGLGLFGFCFAFWPMWFVMPVIRGRRTFVVYITLLSIVLVITKHSQSVAPTGQISS